MANQEHTYSQSELLNIFLEMKYFQYMQCEAFKTTLHSFSIVLFTENNGKEPVSEMPAITSKSLPLSITLFLIFDNYSTFANGNPFCIVKPLS